jgi:hypothetical protein
LASADCDHPLNSEPTLLMCRLTTIAQCASNIDYVDELAYQVLFLSSRLTARAVYLEYGDEQGIRDGVVFRWRHARHGLVVRLPGQQVSADHGLGQRRVG